MAKKRGFERMSYYYKCPNCGANLDPGEICECNTENQNYNVTENCEKNQEGSDNTKGRSIELAKE